MNDDCTDKPSLPLSSPPSFPPSSPIRTSKLKGASVSYMPSTRGEAVNTDERLAGTRCRPHLGEGGGREGRRDERKGKHDSKVPHLTKGGRERGREGGTEA